jgi:flavin reductase (DIM6/NTAB) family NADH-FMN oxidoreductase RutF
VNFLKAEQEEISRVFASKQFAGRRFEYGNWTESDGYVYLSDAQANVFCELRESIAFGTHVLCLGQAERVQSAGPVNPLIYLDGRYFSALEYIGSGA